MNVLGEKVFLNKADTAHPAIQPWKSPDAESQWQIQLEAGELNLESKSCQRGVTTN